MRFRGLCLCVQTTDGSISSAFERDGATLFGRLLYYIVFEESIFFHSDDYTFSPLFWRSISSLSVEPIFFSHFNFYAADMHVARLRHDSLLVAIGIRNFPRVLCHYWLRASFTYEDSFIFCNNILKSNSPTRPSRSFYSPFLTEVNANTTALKSNYYLLFAHRMMTEKWVYWVRACTNIITFIIIVLRSSHNKHGNAFCIKNERGTKKQ